MWNNPGGRWCTKELRNKTMHKKHGLKHISCEIYKSAKELFLILWLLTAIANFLNNIFINKFCEMSKMSELILIRVVKCLAKKVSGVFIIDVYRLHTWINSALQEWNWRINLKSHLANLWILFLRFWYSLRT